MFVTALESYDGIISSLLLTVSAMTGLPVVIVLTLPCSSEHVHVWDWPMQQCAISDVALAAAVITAELAL